MGRYLVLADVHANLHALEAVLQDASGLFDAVWLLGDVVGYGPAPDECIVLLSDYSLVGVCGNHDLGVLGHVALDRFNYDAAEACLWTKRRLSATSMSFLSDLPFRCSRGQFLLVHGSPREPVWEYVATAAQAQAVAPWCEDRHAFVGHTHRPLAAHLSASAVARAPEVSPSGSVTLEERLLLNPGSVGQPRDGDPRAAYAILDTAAEVVSFHRVTYDVGAVAEAIRREGLPRILASRLHVGY